MISCLSLRCNICVSMYTVCVWLFRSSDRCYFDADFLFKSFDVWIIADNASKFIFADKCYYDIDFLFEFLFLADDFCIDMYTMCANEINDFCGLTVFVLVH